MPFPESIRRKELARAKNCAVCREPLPKGAYVEVHSATGLHLVRRQTEKGSKYVVTSTPSGHESLRGRRLGHSVYSNGQKENDAVCLCPACHDEIHRIARAEMSLREKRTMKEVSPEVLEEVTEFFVQKGMKLHVDSLVYDLSRSRRK